MSAKKTTLRILSSLKSIIDDDFSCPICSQPCTDTLVNPACGHRFCRKCIKEQGEGNRDCPTCGVQIAAFQSCRADLHFDGIVSLTQILVYVFSSHALSASYTDNETNRITISSLSPSKFNRVRITAGKSSDGACVSAIGSEREFKKYE